MQTDESISCSKCGYDLRGLSQEAPCPECGNTHRNQPEDMRQGKLMRFIDSNIAVKGLQPVADFRERTKYWMRIGGLFVLALVFLQFIVMFAIIPIGLYRFVLFGLSLLWPYVVYGMMPAGADPSMPPIYRLIRKWIPPTQWCWAVGYVVWFVFYVPSKEGTLGSNLSPFAPILVLHAVAGVGLIGLVFWLHDLALRIELDSASRRCNIVAFVMSTLGIIVFISPWKRVTEGTDGLTPALFWFYVVVLMFPWFWVLILFARALFEFGTDSAWSLKYDRDLEGRQERIREKREEYERKRGW